MTKEEVITRTYTNHDRTMLVTLWPNRQIDVQTRQTPAGEWGMPIRCHEEESRSATVFVCTREDIDDANY